MISGIFTVAAMTAFAGITWWAYSRRNTARFEEASRLPLREDEPAVPASAIVSSDDEQLPPCCRRSAS